SSSACCEDATGSSPHGARWKRAWQPATTTQASNRTSAVARRRLKSPTGPHTRWLDTPLIGERVSEQGASTTPRLHRAHACRRRLGQLSTIPPADAPSRNGLALRSLPGGRGLGRTWVGVPRAPRDRIAGSSGPRFPAPGSVRRALA